MSGKLCYGSSYNNSGAGTLRESKAFADGILYRAEGTALAKPKADNPHETGSEAFTAWDLGWDAAQAAVGGSLPAIGCAAPTGTILA